MDMLACPINYVTKYYVGITSIAVSVKIDVKFNCSINLVVEKYLCMDIVNMPKRLTRQGWHVSNVVRANDSLTQIYQHACLV